MTTLSNSASSSSLAESNKIVCSTGNNVYEMCSLISGLPLHIECITGYDDFVIVGSKDGHLLIYKITFRNQAKLHADIEITLSNKNFTTAIGTNTTRKPVSQLDVIPEHKILIALTSEGISTHDLSMYHCKCISSVERTKGASIFALNIERQTSLTGDPSLTVRMCVAVNRSIQFYYWKNRSFFELREDLAIPDTPRALSWCKEVVLLGFKNEYCQLDTLSGKQQDICSRSKHGEPIITTVSRSEYAVVNDKQCFLFQLSKSESKSRKNIKAHTVALDEKNSKEKNAVITWTEHPIALLYDEPYFVGISSGVGIEIRTCKPKLKIDLFPIVQAKLACSPKSGYIYVASNDSLWCLKSTPVVAQMDLFVKQNHFELALGLSNIWNEVPSEKQKKITQIKNLFAFNLFCKKKFKEAMTIFMELGTDASHVIGLFHGLLPQEFRLQIDYPGQVPELRGADFESGMANLIMFLTNSRTVLLGNSSHTITESASIVEGATIIKSKKQLLQIIDTTLLKCYLQTKESLVASLLRLKDNHCHIEETERALIKHKKFNELIILYQTRGSHRKALETIQTQNDTDRLVEYLQRLGREEMDLILEFAKPVFEQDPEKGLKIFTEDLQEVDQLSRPRVFDFLSKNFPSCTSRYLEHIINVWDEKNSLFHNALVNEYRDKYLSETDGTLHKDELRDGLRRFLVKSQYYSPEIVLVHFPYECMFEERAMVLERMGRHDQVLAIYIVILKDSRKAMEYCKMIFEKHGSSKQDVFGILMKMLLNGPSPLSLPGLSLDVSQHVPDIPSVMRLLKDYAPYLDPMQVLGCLPDDIELRDIQKFLMTSVQNRLSEKRKYLIQKGLIKAEFLRASNEKLMVESERFYIDESTPCAMCNKKIANQNAFVRSPDGSVLHYHCQPGQLISSDENLASD